VLGVIEPSWSECLSCSRRDVDLGSVAVLDSNRAEQFLSHTFTDSETDTDNYFDIEPCNSYLRKLIYETVQDKYVISGGGLTTGLRPSASYLGACSGQSQRWKSPRGCPYSALLLCM